MKRIIILLLSILLCLTACGKPDGEDGSAASDEAKTESVQGADSSQDTDSSQGADSSQDADPAQNTDSDEASEASDPGSSAQTSKYELSIPDDFSEMDIKGMEFYYVNEDGSSISLNVQSKDTDFDSVTADELRQALAASISQTYDEETDITDLYFTANTISGYPAYQYAISYTLQNTAVRQLIVGIDADQTYTFTFTDLSGSWMSTFETSAGTIRLTIR